MYINGKWVDSRSTLISVNPATEEVIGEAYCADEELVQEAVASARKAQEEWSSLSAWERSKYLKRMADQLIKNADEIKELITTEMGRPIFESEIEVYETADMINFFAEEGKAFLSGETYPINNSMFPDKMSFSVREPLGVVGVIKPWNYPLELPMWAIAPALLTGNTVVFKPSELTPLVGTKIAELAEEAGFPPGVFNLIHGDGSVGEKLVLSDVDMIAFTGSVETGKKIMKNSSVKLHKLSLELGGSDPFLVLPSADLEEAVNGAVWGRFTNCGQVCVSAKRIILVKDIANEFINKFKEKVSKLNIGNGLSPETDIGPIVSEEQRKLLIDQLNDTLKQGAKLELGGRIPPNHTKGFFFEPTILTNITPNMRTWKEEVFGPIASIMIVDSVDDAIKVANDSQFGLGASVWSNDLEEVFYTVNKLKCGIIWVNEINVAYANHPWGGVKYSGISKELGREGILEYTNLKHINIDYGKEKTREWWFPYKKNKKKE